MLRTLNLIHPIIQAPMLPLTTPSLVAEVSNSGALGSYAAGPGNPSQLQKDICQIKQLTSKPFQVNLFVPPTTSRDQLMQQMTESQRKALSAVEQQYAKYCQELGIQLPEPSSAADLRQSFKNCVDLIIDEEVPAVSFTFGWPEAALVDRLKRAGVFLIGCCTSVGEAVALEALGAHAVVAQGYEAGGHRATWLDVEEGADYRSCTDGTVTLVADVVRAVRVPVIAAGGIMDGRGVLAALALGAQAAQLGTAFLTTKECGTPPFHRSLLLHPQPTATTQVSQAYTGKPARALTNRIMRDLYSVQADLPNYFCISRARPLFEHAAKTGNFELYPLWAGQGYRRCRGVAAGKLVEQLASEVQEAVRSLEEAVQENKELKKLTE